MVNPARQASVADRSEELAGGLLVVLSEHHWRHWSGSPPLSHGTSPRATLEASHCLRPSSARSSVPGQAHTDLID